MIKPISRLLYLLLFITWIGICASSIYYINAAPSVTPPAVFTPTPVPAILPTIGTIPNTAVPRQIEIIPNTSVPPTVETIPDTAAAGWSLLQPGLERRVIPIYNAQNQHVESLHIWRLDQKYFRIDIAYDETPRSLHAL